MQSAICLPEWGKFTSGARELWDRRWYTNHGPLVQGLEDRLESWLHVEHAICVTNCTIGLMVALNALELKGEITIPAFTFRATKLAVEMAGLTPKYVDVGEDHLAHDITLGVHLWGNNASGCLMYDAAQAFGCNTEIGKCAVYSFHATKIVGAAEGGCIVTNDDEIAERCRNIRSSYGVRKPMQTVTANGRMSEAQALMCHLSLDDYEKNLSHYRWIKSLYAKHLEIMPTGSYIVHNAPHEKAKSVQGLGYFCGTYFPPLADLPNTSRIECIQLPWQNLDDEDVDKICAVL